MKLKKKEKQAIKRTSVIVFLFCSILLVVSFLTYEKPDTNKKETPRPEVSNDVKDYQPDVEKYAKQYNVDNHVDTLLAIMMQESGGRGDDPMQASESYCGERNCIDDPKLSIKQGVRHFSEILDKADGDLKLAVQAYNFGGGFIDYVQEKSADYSQGIAIDFSRKMYEKAPDKEDYRCIRPESEEYEACYGDIYYVKSVMDYRDVIEEES